MSSDRVRYVEGTVVAQTLCSRCGDPRSNCCGKLERALQEARAEVWEEAAQFLEMYPDGAQFAAMLRARAQAEREKGEEDG